MRRERSQRRGGAHAHASITLEKGLLRREASAEANSVSHERHEARHLSGGPYVLVGAVKAAASCAALGYADIASQAECVQAAEALGLANTSVHTNGWHSPVSTCVWRWNADLYFYPEAQGSGGADYHCGGAAHFECLCKEVPCSHHGSPATCGALKGCHWDSNASMCHEAACALHTALGECPLTRCIWDERKCQALDASSGPPAYGHRHCPCVGVAGARGSRPLKTGSTTSVYPEDAGSFCSPWDDGRFVGNCTESDQTPSQGQGWCAEDWCYVDPCNCNIPVAPTLAPYEPGAVVSGRPLYYSHATCKAPGQWAAKIDAAACIHQYDEAECLSMKTTESSAECAWVRKQCVPAQLKEACSSSPDETMYGSASCRCIGVDDREKPPRQTTLTIGGELMNYDAGTGSRCGAWDLNHHSACQDGATNASIPGWCHQPWCYVDPCSCDLPAAKSIMYGATYRGAHVMYSYLTCGASADVATRSGFTDDNLCAERKSNESCTEVPKDANATATASATTASATSACSWIGQACVAAEVARFCPLTEGKVKIETESERALSAVREMGLNIARTLRHMAEEMEVLTIHGEAPCSNHSVCSGGTLGPLFCAAGLRGKHARCGPCSACLHCGEGVDGTCGACPPTPAVGVCSHHTEHPAAPAPASNETAASNKTAASNETESRNETLTRQGQPRHVVAEESRNETLTRQGAQDANATAPAQRAAAAAANASQHREKKKDNNATLEESHQEARSHKGTQEKHEATRPTRPQRHETPLDASQHKEKH